MPTTWTPPPHFRFLFYAARAKTGFSLPSRHVGPAAAREDLGRAEKPDGSLRGE